MTTQTRSRETILSDFLATGEAFAAAVRDLPEHALDCSLAPGEWTVRQIVHHVSDDADLWCFALKKAIASPGAPVRFEGFPGNEVWFGKLGFGARPVASALDLLVAHRRLMVEIASSTPDWEGAFIALFDEKAQPLGKLGVAQILEMLTGHTAEHLNTLRAIRAQNGW